MDTDYLKNRDDIQLLRKAVNTEAQIQRAKITLETLEPQMKELIGEIFVQTGFLLMENNSWTFLDSGKRKYSVSYPSKELALRHLLMEDIEWKE